MLELVNSALTLLVLSQRLEESFRYYVSFIQIEERFFNNFNKQYQNIPESD